jgi:hexosaminidase
VDNGRKYFTTAWLRDHIRELSYLKMNVFHLHLSDREGFRIESFTHPEVPTAPYLTQTEVAELVDFAARYHVTIVPEIDSPGHLTAALRNHPELWMGGTSAGNLDIGIDASYEFMEDLLRELIPLFPGPYWHLGADEYTWGNLPRYATYAQGRFCAPGTTASQPDALIGYVNWLNGLVKSYGKRSFAWHDVSRVVGNTCTTLDQDSVIDFWNHEPTAALGRGHTVFNSNRWYTY